MNLVAYDTYGKRPACPFPRFQINYKVNIKVLITEN